MNINVMLIKENRESRNWTQQHLADVCGLSLRTIQRIEKTGVASRESTASLVSAFDLDGLDSIISHNLENDKTQYLKKIARALYSKSIIVLASFLVCMSLIGLANSAIDSRVWFLVVSLAAAFSLFTISILRIKTP